eukprot:COSAG03_NODE_9532_length_712_cov_2.921697_1_plen_116_part_10
MGGDFCCGNAEAGAQASGLAASLLSFGKPAFILNFSAAMRTFSLFLFAPAVYLLTIDSIAARAAGVSIDDRMSSASASPPRLADSEGVLAAWDIPNCYDTDPVDDSGTANPCPYAV